MAVLTGGGGTEPTFTSCQPVADGLLAAESSEFQFASMPFYVVGAGSPSKLQSKPIRWLFLDEVRNYPAGALDTVLKRTRAFWNSRTVIISTPDREGDTVDRAYQAGDQRPYHIACPGCTQFQPLVWEQLKWNTNETTKPGGQWDFDRLAETIRFECKACGHATRGTPQGAEGARPEWSLRAAEPRGTPAPAVLQVECPAAALGPVALTGRGVPPGPFGRP